jgi:putative FmdB family regulatory protein
VPLRDYKCSSCEHEWEELRRDQTDPEKCPKCEKEAVERKVSAHGGFNFANGASYHNGYKGR